MVFFSESYVFRANIEPTLIIALPGVLLILAYLWEHPLFVTLVCTLSVTFGGANLLALVVRKLGEGKQCGLWKNWGGRPTIRLLRHRRIPGDIELKSGIRSEVEAWLGYSLPTQREEDECPASADAEYGRVVASLMAATSGSSLME